MVDPFIRSIAMTCLIIITLANAGFGAQTQSTPSKISDSAEPMQTGKFEPTWDSLKQYQTPEWFRDAKFGIWAHWGLPPGADAIDVVADMAVLAPQRWI